MIIHIESNFFICQPISLSIKYKKPLVYSSVAGICGFSGIFNKSSHSPCLMCFLKKFGSSGESCELNGVLGPVVGVIGSVQATNVIKLLTDIDTEESVLYFDARKLDFLKLNIKKLEKCVCCNYKQSKWTAFIISSMLWVTLIFLKQKFLWKLNPP